MAGFPPKATALTTAACSGYSYRSVLKILAMTNDCMKTIEQTRVLVVEDETRLCDVLISSVSELGYQASGARSGEEGLRMMNDEPRDIVILDLNLPGMEGLEFFENIPTLSRILGSLNEVGLGYIALGQSSTTLSGGEAQRRG